MNVLIFINKYYSALGQIGSVNFLYLRNYENIDKIVPGDLDIFVDGDITVESIIEFNLNFLTDNPSIDFQTRFNKYGFYSCHFFDRNTGWEIVVDFYFQFIWRGLNYINTESLKVNWHYFYNLKVLNHGSDIAVLLMKELLGAKKVRSKVSQLKLVSYSMDDKDGFFATLNGILPLSLVKIIYKHSINNNRLMLTFDGIIIRSYLFLTNPYIFLLESFKQIFIH